MKKINNTLFIVMIGVFLYWASPIVGMAILEKYPKYALAQTEKLNSHINKKTQSSEPVSIGEYGDLFGSLNSIFTATSLILLAASFFYQTFTYREESDRNATRDIENNFFSMLSQLSNIVDTIDIRKSILGGSNKEIIVTGTEALQTICDTLIANARSMKNKGLASIGTLKLENLRKHRAQHGTALTRDYEGYRIAVIEIAKGTPLSLVPYERYSEIAYRACFLKYNHDLAHYVNFCYRIIKYIDQSAISYQKKIDLISILRASLSTPELTLIFYQCLSANGSKFKQLAEKYALFDNIDRRLLIDEKRECSLFSPTAFQPNRQIAKRRS